MNLQCNYPFGGNHITCQVGTGFAIDPGFDIVPLHNDTKRIPLIFNKGFARVTFSHLESRGDLGVDGVGRRGDFIAAVLPEFRGVGFAGGLNVWLIRLHGKWV